MKLKGSHIEGKGGTTIVFYNGWQTKNGSEPQL